MWDPAAFDNFFQHLRFRGFLLKKKKKNRKGLGDLTGANWEEKLV